VVKLYNEKIDRKWDEFQREYGLGKYEDSDSDLDSDQNYSDHEINYSVDGALYCNLY